jgi:AraC family transcriptional regulator, transcriptional activator of pobA
VLIHDRLVREACVLLQQLDLPVEQIGYGLSFRDAAYFTNEGIAAHHLR